MSKLKKISIIVPVYNEAATIGRILSRVIKANTLGLEKEIIVVNDGSTDQTAAIIDAIRSKFLRVFHRPYNKGKGAALRYGFSKATGQIILIQDADLEYSPKDYPKLIEPFLKQTARVVYGSRMLEHKKMEHSGWQFYIGGQFINWLTNALYNVHLTDEATGYKVFDARLLKSITLRCERFEFCPEITAKLAKRNIPIYEVPIAYRGRKVSEGKKINWKDGIEAMWTLVKFKFID